MFNKFVFLLALMALMSNSLQGKHSEIILKGSRCQQSSRLTDEEEGPRLLPKIVN